MSEQYKSRTEEEKKKNKEKIGQKVVLLRRNHGKR